MNETVMTEIAEPRPRPSWTQRASDYFGLRGPREAAVAAALFGLMLLFRVINILTWKFETDESQHLHVIWGWARGFVQYRDLCDNHMPLFQLFFAPVYALIGDRPTILYWMRFCILPFYLAAVWANYRIAALAFSRRVAVWAVLLVGFYPGYALQSLEFRTDNLWAPLWLCCILVLVKGPFTARRAFGAGLLLGVCFGVSMKSALLLLSLLAGAILTFALLRRRIGPLSARQIAASCGSFLLGVLLVPGSIIAGFASAGLWPQFRYWVFENNLLPGLRNHPAWWIYLFPLLFPAVFCATAFVVRRISDSTTAFRRGFLLLTFGFYVLALWSYWPLVTRQDYLPFQPGAFTFYAAALLALTDRLLASRGRVTDLFSSLPLPALCAALEFLLCIVLKPFWRNTARVETDLLRAVHQLTEPGDFVLDEKGETVFRQRAFAPIWEPLVVERIRRGLIVDNAAQRCIETHTCVARRGKDMSAAARQFIDEHFLPVGHGLYVAGAQLTAAPTAPPRFDFKVAIPAPYEVIAPPPAVVTGLLDGTPYTGARLLGAGDHTFVETSGPDKLALLWAQAADRNFTPFH